MQSNTGRLASRATGRRSRAPHRWCSISGGSRFVNERATPLEDLTAPWTDAQQVSVGTVTFVQTDPDAADASSWPCSRPKWAQTRAIGKKNQAPIPCDCQRRHSPQRGSLRYRASQQSRRALPDESYASYFERGEIGPALANELIRRYQDKRAAGHWVPDVGEMAVV